MSPRLKLLFLCTGNSCRSQMGEGWTRRLKADRIDVASAGIEARGFILHKARESGVHHASHS